MGKDRLYLGWGISGCQPGSFFCDFLNMCLGLFLPLGTDGYLMFLSNHVSMPSGVTSIVILAIIHKPTKLVWLFVCAIIISLIVGFMLSFPVLFLEFLFQPSSSPEGVGFIYSINLYYTFVPTGFEPSTLVNTFIIVGQFGFFVTAVLLFCFYLRYSSPYKTPLLLLAALYTFGLLASFHTPVSCEFGRILDLRGIAMGRAIIGIGDKLAYGSLFWGLFVGFPMLAFPISLFVMGHSEKMKTETH